MNLRSLTIYCSVALLAICSVILVAGEVLVESFEKIEIAKAKDSAVQIERALETDLNQLAVSVRDYAEWDEAEAFVNRPASRFLRANFSYNSLSSMQVDAVLILSNKGQVLYSAAVDEVNHKIVTPAKESLINLLQPYQHQVDELRQRPSRERILNTVNGLLAFAVIEVTNSDLTHHTGAVIFFARYINVDELERIRETSQVPVELVALNTAGKAADIIDPKLNAWMMQSTQTERFYAQSVDEHRMDSYVLIRDVNGERVALLSTNQQRDIYNLGYKTTWNLLGVLIGLSVLSTIILMCLLLLLQRSQLVHAAAKRRYSSVIEHLEETIVLANRTTGKIIEANNSFLNTLNYTLDELVQLTLKDVYSNLQIDQVAQRDNAGAAVQECKLRTKAGDWVSVEVTVSAFIDAGVDVLCVLGRDISSRQLAEVQAIENRRRLMHLANHDALTGLPNRLYLQNRLPRLLRKLATRKGIHAVYYVDVDHFKNINDSKGHGAGDQLLKAIAERLQGAVSSHDIVIRMGGDEFVVVAILLPDLPAVEDVAQRLIATLQAPIVIDDVTTSVTASVGISIYPNDGLDYETLLKHADIALYQAKEKGRNSYQIFTPKMDLAVSEHVALEQALRHAIGTSQIQVVYQPVVNIFSEQLESVEALARWEHPEMGNVPPMRFIPIAENSGLIEAIGEQMLRTVCQQLRYWLDEGVSIVPVAVNVSPLQLRRATILPLVQSLTQEFSLDPKWLRFEITESAVLQESQEIFQTLQTLRDLGSVVMIDDFGTGFSNLSSLKRMPVDVLKIDQSFVRDVVNDAGDAAIIGSIVSMAKELRLQTIAEGIETREQLQRLRSLGCQYGQGYYFSLPIKTVQCRTLFDQLDNERRFGETLRATAAALGR